MKRLLEICIIVGFVLALSGGMWWWGFRHAANTMQVVHVTPSVLANAMQADHFYSDYGTAALLVSGTVSRVSAQDGRALVTFDTSSTYNAICRVNGPVFASTGSRVTALTLGAHAERQTNGVLLQDCIFVTDSK